MPSTSKPRSHYARGHQRRAEVVAATIEVIERQGIEGVTHRSVAAAAGVPLSTTSYFFDSLDHLIGEAVTKIAEDVVAGADALIVQLRDAEGGSRREVVERLIELMSVQRPGPLVAQFEAYLATTRRPELRAAVQRIVGVYEDTAVAVFEALEVDEPRLAARQLVALLDGLALLSVAAPRPDDTEVRRDALRRLAAVHLGPDWE